MTRDPSTPREPVFIVGSPRSGTSILTWCLGQHPNLLGLEESNWMAPFAVDVAVAFRRGSARGERSQFSAMGIDRDRLMSDLGACIDDSIVGHRAAYEERITQRATPDAPGNHEAFKISRDESEPKGRWVNGTPEYSLGLGGLRELFPDARFVHLLRNCDDVVPSLVQLDRLAGTKQVSNEQEAYELWMQFVRACVEAEQAWGPEVVCRLRHEDLVREPEASIRRILDFIGEPFDQACLEPLAKRINSSRGTAEEAVSDPPADPAVVREAQQLWEELRTTPPAAVRCEDAAARLDDSFEQRVDYIHELDTRYARAQRAHIRLEKEFVARSEWAANLEGQVKEKSALILQMQEEFDDRTAWALRLKEEVQHKDELIDELERRLATWWSRAGALVSRALTRRRRPRDRPR